MSLRLPVALAVCLLLLLALPPAAGAAEPGFTTTEHVIPVVDGPSDDQEVLVDATLYVPHGVTAARQAPVVINAHGFAGSKESDKDMSELLANAGYVVFAYSSRGFGDTTGKIGLDSVHYDVKDVRQLIDWLADRDEVLLDGPRDPRLGMVGPSYGGGIQLQVAGVDERVDVIVPYITWHSLVSSLSPNYLHTDLRLQDGRPIGVFKEQWTSLFFAAGNGQILTSPPPPGEPVPCPNFVDPLCEAYTETVLRGRAAPEAIEILKESSPATQPRLAHIDIPTLLIQGQSDTLFTVNEAAANYTAIKANGAPVKMIWSDGGHGYPYAKGEVQFLQQRTLAWFDRHLAGGTGVDTGPGFEYYRRWADGSTAERYATAGRFPVANATTLFLSSESALTTSRRDATAGDITFASTPAITSYSETSNFQNTDPFKSIPAQDAPGTFAAFTTPPLARAATVVGIPTVQFDITSTIGEAQLFAKIYDVAPDGSQTLVRRVVAPLRATDLDIALKAQLVGIAHRFDEGHAIRLVFASTDAAYANLRVPTQYTMTINPGSATLTLPLVGAGSVKVRGEDTPRGRDGASDGGRTGDTNDTGSTNDTGGSTNDAGGGTTAQVHAAATLPATGGGPFAPVGIALLGGAAVVARTRRRLRHP